MHDLRFYMVLMRGDSPLWWNIYFDKFCINQTFYIITWDIIIIIMAIDVKHNCIKQQEWHTIARFTDRLIPRNGICWLDFNALR